VSDTVTENAHVNRAQVDGVDGSIEPADGIRLVEAVAGGCPNPVSDTVANL